MRKMKKLLTGALLTGTILCNFIPCAFADCSGSSTWVREKFPDRHVEFFVENGINKVRVYNKNNQGYKTYTCTSMDGNHCFICD